jgi:hypothetical protein
MQVGAVLVCVASLPVSAHGYRLEIFFEDLASRVSSTTDVVAFTNGDTDLLSDFPFAIPSA